MIEQVALVPCSHRDYDATRIVELVIHRRSSSERRPTALQNCRASGDCRHAVGHRWFVDETSVKVAGVWRYVYRAVDGHGQVIDVLVSRRRDIAAARTFFAAALAAHGAPVEVVTDRAAALAHAIAELNLDAAHNTDQYANNRIECDHGRLKARLRPMRGLKRDRTASVIIRGQPFVQNLRRGHYELGADARHRLVRVAAAFNGLATTI